jgi:hypothetical protein
VSVFFPPPCFGGAASTDTASDAAATEACAGGKGGGEGDGERGAGSGERDLRTSEVEGRAWAEAATAVTADLPGRERFLFLAAGALGSGSGSGSGSGVEVRGGFWFFDEAEKAAGISLSSVARDLRLRLVLLRSSAGGGTYVPGGDDGVGWRGADAGIGAGVGWEMALRSTIRVLSRI